MNNLDIQEMVVLRPKTIKGKSRINELKVAVIDKPAMKTVNDEQIWRVDDVRDKVIFSQDPGPWLYISPETNDNKVRDKFARWVKRTDDAHFIVLSVAQSLSSKQRA